jgi:hypothetical protein
MNTYRLVLKKCVSVVFQSLRPLFVGVLQEEEEKSRGGLFPIFSFGNMYKKTKG